MAFCEGNKGLSMAITPKEMQRNDVSIQTLMGKK